MCKKKMGKRNEWGFEEKKTRLLVIFSELFMRYRLLNLGKANYKYAISVVLFILQQNAKKKENNQEQHNTVDKNCHRYLGYQSHIKIPSVTSFSWWIKMEHDRKSSQLIQSNRQIRIICSVTLIFELICFSSFGQKFPNPKNATYILKHSWLVWIKVDRESVYLFIKWLVKMCSEMTLIKRHEFKGSVLLIWSQTHLYHRAESINQCDLMKPSSVSFETPLGVLLNHSDTV